MKQSRLCLLEIDEAKLDHLNAELQKGNNTRQTVFDKLEDLQPLQLSNEAGADPSQL